LRNVIRQEVKRAINEGNEWWREDEDLGPPEYVPPGPDAADEAEAAERANDVPLDALMLATPSQILQIKKILKLKL
jgi:hypothetical protein